MTTQGTIHDVKCDHRQYYSGGYRWQACDRTADFKIDGVASYAFGGEYKPCTMYRCRYHMRGLRKLDNAVINRIEV